MPANAPVHNAAKTGDITTVRKCLMDDVDVNIKGMVRLSPVYLFPPIITSFLKQCGNTPLHWASGSGETEIVKLLIEKGANIEATTNVLEHIPFLSVRTFTLFTLGRLDTPISSLLQGTERICFSASCERC